MWFRGTVFDESPRSDGDLHADIYPDKGYETFLNDGNRKDKGGAMVVEIMPGQTFPRFSQNEHVAVYGTWVHDTHNDWNEIHPVWAIDYLDRHKRVVDLPPVTPEYNGDADD